MSFWDFLSGSTPAGVISDTGQKVVSSVFTGVKELIEEFHLSPEQAQQARLRLAELELRTYQTRISDVQSARQMQTAVQSPWPGILTLVSTAGFFSVMVLIIWKGLPTTSEAGGQAILLLIGALIAGYTQVLGFWFGTTMSSRAKDELLANSISTTAMTAMKSTDAKPVP